MRIARNHDGVTIHAPAKLNLFLEILAKRSDGFHEIETLMSAIDLRDTLHFRPLPDCHLRLQIRHADARSKDVLGEVPMDSTNIVLRALEKLRTAASVHWGAEITLVKRIPAAAGLGGASSDAAAALMAANEAWRLRLSHDELATIAAEIGSDVPFFLGAPQAVCRGRGEQIAGLAPLPALHVVVVRPPEGLSTPAVYKACRTAETPRPVAPAINAWRRGDLAALAAGMTNRLEPAAAALSPWIARLRDEFARQGCYGFQMSGSGSSYFGIARHAVHARRIAARLRARRCGHVVVARTLSQQESAGGGTAV